MKKLYTTFDILNKFYRTHIFIMPLKNYRHLSLIFILLLFTCQSISQQKINNTKENIISIKTLKPTKIFSEGDKTKKSDLKILSWNIQDLGQSKSEEIINQIAQIIRDFDIVAIQEVVAKDPKGAQAVAKIADELNRMGTKWDYIISDPTKSPSSYMSERYAYIWKTSKLDIIHRAFLDTVLENHFIREPYIGKFQLKKGNKPFYLINVHARVFNDNPENEIIHFKDYPTRLKTDNIIILGDFNLNQNHPVWDNIYKLGFKPSIQNAPTTLKKDCVGKKYLNHSIDNIYYNTSKINLINSGRIDFVNNCDALETARKISDHLPVFLECIIP